MPKIIENLESRLIQEAGKQVLQSGYGAVTIRSIAAGCGVGVGTVYNYFSSKEQLLASYLLQDWNACVAAIEAVSDGSASAEPVLRCIYDQLTAYALRHQPVFRDEDARSAVSGSFSRYHSLLRSQLAAPLEKFSPSPFAAEFIAEALLTWTMAGKSFDDLCQLIEKLL